MRTLAFKSSFTTYEANGGSISFWLHNLPSNDTLGGVFSSHHNPMYLSASQFSRAFRIAVGLMEAYEVV